MNSQESQKKLLKNTGIMSIAVFFSRILGLVRDQVMAAYFGVSFVNDAFNVGYNIPNLLRRLFGEGALSAAFVPLYNEFGIKRGKRYQILFALNLLSVVSAILLILTVLGILFSPLIVKLIYPGLSSETSDLAINLSRILFPYLFFIGLSSTMIAILNSHNKFFITGLSSALLNLAWIGMIFIGALFNDDPEQLVYFASLGILLGGFLQTVINFPFLKKIGYSFKIIIKLQSTAMKTLWKRFIPGMIGLGIREINLLMDALIASFLPGGSISALGFGNRLMQLPLGIFGISAGTAVLPSFSRSLINKDWEELSNTLRFSILFMLYIMLPVTAFICGGAYEVVVLLFKRGVFGDKAVLMTVQALICYSLGLCFYGLNQTITPVFYASKDTKTPMIIALFMCITNIVLNVILMLPLKHAGLALATSITAMIQFVIMIRVLLKRFPEIKLKGIIRNTIKIMIISIILFYIIRIISHFWISSSFVLLAVKVLSMGFIWLFFFFGLGLLFKLEYWDIFYQRLCKKIMRK